MTFDKNKYNKIGIDQLLIFCIFRLESRNEEVTFENLVKESFKNFPRRFRLLLNDQNWPDATIIDKSLVRLRTDKYWITGNRASGFKLTPLGLKIAEKIGKELKSIITDGKVELIGEQTKSARIIKHILNSEAYKRYKNKKENTITEYEFDEAIFSTVDSPVKNKIGNLRLVRQHINGSNNKSIKNFLNFLESRYLKIDKDTV